MKKIQLFIVVGLVSGLSSLTFAQNSASANATANATIIKPLTITWNQPLAFGQLTPGVGAATAVIGVTGISVSSASYIAEAPVVVNTTSVNNQATAFFGDKNPGPAVFTVTGQLGYSFAISLPPVTQVIPVHLINNTTSSPDMTLDNFTSVVGNPGAVGSTGTLSLGTGFQFFAVGGTLHIPSGATPGFYQGQFIVTVAYN